MAVSRAWTRRALPIALSPWLTIAGIVLSAMLDQPLLFAAGVLVGGLALESARRANPRDPAADWWKAFEARQFADSDSPTAARICRVLALVGIAVLAASFLLLVVMSALSFAGITME